MMTSIFTRRSAYALFACSFIWVLLLSSPILRAQDTSERFAPIQPLIKAAIDEGKLPGCVITIGRSNEILYRQAFGHRAVEPSLEPMTEDTIFDLASLTKPLATGLSVMQLVEQGAIELDAPVSQYLPEFSNNGKESITVRHLLIHQSGLIPDNPMSDYADGEALAWQRIYELKPVGPIGSKFSYSDVNFLVLGALVERISRERINQYFAQHIANPLGLSETGYNPLLRPNAATIRTRIAPTEKRDGNWIRGEVHDPRAFALGGVAGHAGLFSSSKDLSRLAQTLLATLREKQVSILRPDTLATMTADQTVSSGLRGLAWDKQTGFSSNKGQGMSSSAFGHGGFTGTAIWIDPELDLFVVFLSNRLHPDGMGNVNALAGEVGTIAVKSLTVDQPK